MKKQNKSVSKSKFETLFEAAMEDDNLFNSEEEIIDQYDDVNETPSEDEEEVSEVTIKLTSDQVDVLKAILDQLEGDTEEEVAPEDSLDDGIEELEELEKESVEFETAPDADTVVNSTKSGKATTDTGELDTETSKKDGEEKQYKFVKREKPEELKYKTTKGS